MHFFFALVFHRSCEVAPSRWDWGSPAANVINCHKKKHLFGVVFFGSLVILLLVGGFLFATPCIAHIIYIHLMNQSDQIAQLGVKSIYHKDNLNSGSQAIAPGWAQISWWEWRRQMTSGLPAAHQPPWTPDISSGFTSKGIYGQRDWIRWSKTKAGSLRSNRVAQSSSVL